MFINPTRLSELFSTHVRFWFHLCTLTYADLKTIRLLFQTKFPSQNRRNTEQKDVFLFPIPI